MNQINLGQMTQDQRNILMNELISWVDLRLVLQAVQTRLLNIKKDAGTFETRNAATRAMMQIRNALKYLG